MKPVVTARDERRGALARASVLDDPDRWVAEPEAWARDGMREHGDLGHSGGRAGVPVPERGSA